MVFIPDIIDYKPLYIQTDAEGNAIDIKERFGIIVQENPDIVMPKAKQPYKNEWLDEDGDDEYNAQMHYEAMEINIGIYVSGDSAGDVRQAKDALFEMIRNGEFSLYFSALQRGYKKVRYVSESMGRKIIKKRYTEISTITLKVNDPITHIALTDGKLVEV